MEEPTITIPISWFKELCLGYKYSSYDGKEADNLRDKCVLRLEVVNLIKQTPSYEKYFHIQSTGKDSLPLVWDIREWKDAGERRSELIQKLDKDKERAERLFILLKGKFPAGIDGNVIKAMCLQYIKDGVDLSGFGIKPEDYM